MKERAMNFRILRREWCDLSHLTVTELGDDILDQGRSRSDEKQWSSRTTGFLNALGVGYKRKRGVKNNYKVTELNFEKL